MDINLFFSRYLIGSAFSFLFIQIFSAQVLADANSEFHGLEWQPCFQETGWPFECAILSVPLDHQHKGKIKSKDEYIGIAMTRLAATDQTQYQGSLFLNPGGPGGSGIQLLLNIGPWFLTEQVRAKFDLIGFDPRGIGQSHPLKCFRSMDEIQPLLDLPVYPTTYAEEQELVAFARQAVKYCKSRGGQILDHMTTADVARDMDLMRQAVGDEKLYYYGFSYGSYLGVTYANLFPDKVGAIVVDAALDPVAWATGRNGEKHYSPVSSRIGSDKGASDTLKEFFRLCDIAATEICPLSGNAETRFFNVVEQLKISPVPIETPDGIFQFSHDILNAVALNAMYNSDSWIELSWLVNFLEINSSAATIGAQYQLLLSSLGRKSDTSDGEQLLDVVVEDFFGVMCSDSDNPNNAFFWSQSAEFAESENGAFGRIWTWNSIYCEKLGPSRRSRFAGPFNHDTLNPVLIINTFFDPATYYEGALKLNSILPNSHFLPVAGWGHGSAFASSCSDQVASLYILTGELPESGTVCQQDFPPFNLPWEIASAELSPPVPQDSFNKTRSAPSIPNRADNQKNRRQLMRSLATKKERLKHLR